MTSIQTLKQAREEADIHHTGRWYIAEIDSPQLAVQGESESDARQRLAKRWEEYTANSDESDIQLGSSEADSDRTRRKVTPSRL